MCIERTWIDVYENKFKSQKKWRSMNYCIQVCLIYSYEFLWRVNYSIRKIYSAIGLICGEKMIALYRRMVLCVISEDSYVGVCNLFIFMAIARIINNRPRYPTRYFLPGYNRKVLRQNVWREHICIKKYGKKTDN